MSRDVMLPILSSAASQGQWPGALSRQITDSLHKFVADGTYCTSVIMIMQHAFKDFQLAILCVREEPQTSELHLTDGDYNFARLHATDGFGVQVGTA